MTHPVPITKLPAGAKRLFTLPAQSQGARHTDTMSSQFITPTALQLIGWGRIKEGVWCNQR